MIKTFTAVPESKSNDSVAVSNLKGEVFLVSAKNNINLFKLEEQI